MRRAEAFRREDLAAPGEYVIEPQRSGGAFDPLGLRAGHVARADDVAALGDVLRGRWLFITLTVDRSKFLSPAMAYQRCNPRVCRVAAALREAAVWVAAFEVQTKTGDGWPHWHMMIHVGEDGRSLAELKAVVERAWCVVSEHEGEVDRSTGEVLTWKAREQIGFVDVQDGRSAGGLARYVAKYVTKPWDEVPGWMLQSSRQLRKIRSSTAAFEVWERLGRHARRIGARRVPGRRRRAARPLVDRMASSGASVNVFRRTESGTQFVASVPVPMDERGFGFLLASGARVARLGAVRQVRLVADHAAYVRILLRSRARPDLRASYLAERRASILAAWMIHQAERSIADPLSPEGGSVPDLAPEPTKWERARA